LVDVASGLDYLHSHGVVHGDIKGVSTQNRMPSSSLIKELQPNILVDASGRARITDFGLAQDIIGGISIAEGQSARWTAPEVSAEEERPSKEADIFSFAMVMVEVCCN
jgi:serine/threonine protein kinase